MPLVCFDTNVLIWGIKNEAHPSQQDMIEKANALILQCHEKRDTVLIPAIVVAEMLCNAPRNTHSNFYQILNSNFIIVPYDARVALVHAQIWQEREALRLEFRSQNISRQASRADFQIAAIAVANSCNTLYTEDGPLYRIVERYLEVKKVSDTSLPPHQPKLFE